MYIHIFNILLRKTLDNGNICIFIFLYWFNEIRKEKKCLGASQEGKIFFVFFIIEERTCIKKC